jgi:hypothetical protein
LSEKCNREFNGNTIEVSSVWYRLSFLTLGVLLADSAVSPVMISTLGFPFRIELVEVRGR